MEENSNSIEEYISLEEKEQKSLKDRFKAYLESPFWTVTIIVLVSITFFALGRVSRVEELRQPVRVVGANATLFVGENTDQLASPVLATAGEKVVASKSGTKYHYPWCSGAQRIAEKNLITFNSPEEARKAGLTPASNCKGLK